MLNPRILLPFLGVVLIWGSTWIVIKDGLGVVPAPWSVTYRFTLAAAAMFALIAARRQRLWLAGPEWGFALAIGAFQFVANFNFVYAAEGHVTSGLVSLVFALLMVPNAALSRWWLKTPITGGFLSGSAIAIMGVALLFAVEIRRGGAGEDVPLGIALTLGGVLAASVANVAPGDGHRPRRADVERAGLGHVVRRDRRRGHRARLARRAGVGGARGLLGGRRIPGGVRLGGGLSALFRADPRDRAEQGGLRQPDRAGGGDGA